MEENQISTEKLLAYLANAYATYLQCGGHHKANMNEMKVKKYKAQLDERKTRYPSDKDLGEIGVFNGDGAY